MIKYALICECSSKFEGWFPTNEGYENQLAQGQVVCPMCDSTKVRKDIMAPNVKKKTTQIKIKSPRQRGKEAMLNMTGGQMVLGGRARSILKKIEPDINQRKKIYQIAKNYVEKTRNFCLEIHEKCF